MKLINRNLDEALTTTKSATEGAGVPPITLDKTETQKEPCPASSVLDFEEMVNTPGKYPCRAIH